MGNIMQKYPYLVALKDGEIKKAYLILTDGNQVLGGVGAAEFPGFADCAEIQKLQSGSMKNSAFKE